MRLWVILIIIIISTSVKGQPSTLKLNVSSGQKQSFVFNLSDHFENGITKSSSLYIYYDATANPLSTGWELYVYTSSTELNNYFGSGTITLNTLSIDFTQTGGENINGTIHPLSDVNLTHLIGEWKVSNSTDIGTSQVTINVNCGGLLHDLRTELDGDYFVNLEFYLIEQY